MFKELKWTIDVERPVIYSGISFLTIALCLGQATIVPNDLSGNVADDEAHTATYTMCVSSDATDSFCLCSQAVIDKQSVYAGLIDLRRNAV